MSGLVQRVVELRVEQDEFLQRRSREIGVSEDELVRQAIDAMSERPQLSLEQAAAWKRLKQSMELRARMDVPQTGRTWTRSDLYDADARH